MIKKIGYDCLRKDEEHTLNEVLFDNDDICKDGILKYKIYVTRQVNYYDDMVHVEIFYRAS